MANIQSAKKRIRTNAHKQEVNRRRRSRIRTYIKSVENAIAAGDAKVAQEALKAAQPELHRGVTKGLLHQRTAARKLSRLNKRIKTLAG